MVFDKSPRFFSWEKTHQEIETSKCIASSIVLKYYKHELHFYVSTVLDEANGQLKKKENHRTFDTIPSKPWLRLKVLANRLSKSCFSYHSQWVKLLNPITNNCSASFPPFSIARQDGNWRYLILFIYFHFLNSERRYFNSSYFS